MENNYKVICLDNFNDYYNTRIKEDNIAESLKNKKFTLVKGGILNKECLKDIFSENNIHKIIHLAALAGVRLSLQKTYKFEIFNLGNSKTIKLRNLINTLKMS